jgi:hypothetical protein
MRLVIETAFKGKLSQINVWIKLKNKQSSLKTYYSKPEFGIRFFIKN